jgi:hypothetical protein
MSDEQAKLGRLFRAADGLKAMEPAGHEVYLAQLAEFVESELAGENLAARYANLLAHLDVCVSCSAEYAALLDLAIAEQNGLLAEGQGMPALRLEFLASPSLSELVRGWVGQIGRVLDARMLPDIDALLGPFLQRAQALGDQPLPALSPSLGEGQDALRVLAATYATTQTIVADIARRTSEENPSPDVFRAFLRSQAEQEAARQGIKPDQAQAFAEQYALIASESRQILQVLALKRSTNK